jgi:hypothetical protein
MRLSDFSIGIEFFTGAGRWRCSDVGSPTITAFELNQSDTSWYVGPPYAVAECVFDEEDQKGCTLDPDEYDVNPSAPTA